MVAFTVASAPADHIAQSVLGPQAADCRAATMLCWPPPTSTDSGPAGPVTPVRDGRPAMPSGVDWRQEVDIPLGRAVDGQVGNGVTDDRRGLEAGPREIRMP